MDDMVGPCQIQAGALCLKRKYKHEWAVIFSLETLNHPVTVEEERGHPILILSRGKTKIFYLL